MNIFVNQQWLSMSFNPSMPSYIILYSLRIASCELQNLSERKCRLAIKGAPQYKRIKEIGFNLLPGGLDRDTLRRHVSIEVKGR